MREMRDHDLRIDSRRTNLTGDYESNRSSVEVSVIVLAHRATWLLENCLSALASHQSSVDFEVIVVLNGATAEVKQVVQGRPGIRVIESRANRGFAGGCNRGASFATGRYLLFLNDDAVVNEGWLDALLHVARTHPEAGAVSSLIVDEEKQVLEFGGHLRDCIPSPLGRGLSLHDAQLLPPREVAYASACSLLIEADYFESLGRFDESYYPAYFEDPDLCLRIWESGRSVVVTAASVITHRESSSTSTAYRQIIFGMAELRFRENWMDRPSPLPANLPRGLPSIFYIDDSAPRSASGSGMARARALIECVTELGIHLRLLVKDDRFGIGPGLLSRGVVLYDDLEGQGGIESPTAVIVSRPHNLESAIEFRRAWPETPLIYDAEARFSARLEAQIPLASTVGHKNELETELQELLRLERLAANTADTIITISEQEAEWFRSSGAESVYVLDPFPSTCDVGTRSFLERRRIVFIAGWLSGSESPNADGLRWFLTEVIPHLNSIVPGLIIDVTGDNPPDELVSLAPSNVRFVGEVVDFDEYLGKTRVTIAPIRFGAGVKLKVVDSLARGVPVVGTSTSLDGLPPKWVVGCVVEDDPVRFSESLARLVIDEKEWRELRDPLVEVCSNHHADPVAEWRTILAMSTVRAQEREARG